eukprot:393154-Prymnesium_polylepis.1
MSHASRGARRATPLATVCDANVRDAPCASCRLCGLRRPRCRLLCIPVSYTHLRAHETLMNL